MSVENLQVLPESPASHMGKSVIEKPTSQPLLRVRAAWLLHAVGALIFSGLILAYIQFAAPNIVDYDGYYHIKTALLMRQQGVPLDFPYLKFTIMDRQGYTDPHLGMHFLQIPFTFLGDLILAAKLAPVCFAAITFTIFYLLLRHYRIRLPLLWLVLLFASSSPFLYRMSMARGQALSLAFQLLAFHLIINRRAKSFFALTVLFVWTYNAFPMLVPMLLFGLITHYVSDRVIDYKLPLALAAGIITGHLLNPYYPRNILFIWDHIVPKLFAVNYETAVGSEWYPYSSWAMLTMSLVAFLAYAAGIFFTSVEEWKGDKPRLLWFLISSMYLILLMKSRRFVEYFPPSAIMFFAFAVRHRLPQLDFSGLLSNKRRAAAALATVVLLFFAAHSTIKAAREDVAGEPASLAYKGGAEWLANNTPAGARVFHTDWDDFPMLYFYNTHNTYLVGLDPDFMRLKDEKLFRRYEDITLGRVAEPEEEILYDFGCEYIITDNDHGDFLNIAGRRPRLERVFSDRYTTVFRILEKLPLTPPREVERGGR
jgi:hypothetical protein